MKFENLTGQSRGKKNLSIGVVFLVALVVGMLIGMPRLLTASAHKSEGAQDQDADKNAARALLENAIKSGTFEMMSSSKQSQLLLQAGMKFKGGVLKPSEVAIPSSGEEVKKSRGSVPAADSPFSLLPNPLVNDPAADTTSQKTQSETTIVQTGPTTLVAAYNDSGSFSGVNAFTGYSTSTDMGATWTDRGAVPVLVVGNFGDPVLAHNSTTGTVYLSTIAAITNGMNVYRSTDSGVTWSAVSNGAPGTNAADGDKEWLTVDNFAGDGNGNVYFAYRDFGVTHPGVLFTRSTDGGVTFGPSPGLTIATQGSFNVQGAHVSVGADHAVYVTWHDQSAGSGTLPFLRIRKSTDQGVTFGPPVNIAQLNNTAVNGNLGIPAGYRSDAFPQVFPNAANASILYAVHNDINLGGTDRGDIYFQQSTDGGATWSVRTKINTDATTRVQAFPAIAVTPDGSSLCVSWYDNRDDVANKKVERFAAIASISGTTVTFGPNFEAGNAAWTPVFGQDPVVNGVYMGDYDEMTADNSFFYTTFVDCRLGNQDVRFAKIPLAGPGPIVALQSFIPTFLSVARNTCNDVFITVANNGTATANAVTATLTTATPGVTIENGTQSFGDIAAGGTVTNASPYKLSIDNTFACGTPIVINVTFSDTSSTQFTIGTQGAGYQATTMTGQTIVPGTTDIGNHGDDLTTAITLPFSFTFFGQSFSTARVSSNGNLQFTSNNSTFANVCPLPASGLNNAIMPFWFDLILDGPGEGIFTSTSGSAPNRIFNIEWRAESFDFGGTFNFEIRLYEATGQIDFVYGTLFDGSSDNNGGQATVGIQKGTGSGGPSDIVQFSCNQPNLSSGLKVSFTTGVGCPQGAGSCGACVLACPANITKSNDSNQCGALVTYPAPTSSGGCGTVSCSPASGTFFPKGTTTVTCTGSTGGGSCAFTVTVNDTQAPTIACPANITAITPNPGDACAVVAYPPPAATDNCPGVTAACVPPAGTCFPRGTTTVTCTATDTSGNTKACAFTVTVFDVCLQDDGNPGSVVLFNSLSGEYRFCCGGDKFTGVGTVKVTGSIFTLTDNSSDRRVRAMVDAPQKKGDATLQAPPGTGRCSITDRNTANNTCVCQ